MFLLAHLNDAQLKTLREFEERQSMHVLAFENVDVAPDQLNPDTLEDLRETEQKTGLTLVAVK